MDIDAISSASGAKKAIAAAIKSYIASVWENNNVRLIALPASAFSGLPAPEPLAYANYSSRKLPSPLTIVRALEWLAVESTPEHPALCESNIAPDYLKHLFDVGQFATRLPSTRTKRGLTGAVTANVPSSAGAVSLRAFVICSEFNWTVFSEPDGDYVDVVKFTHDEKGKNVLVAGSSTDTNGGKGRSSVPQHPPLASLVIVCGIPGAPLPNNGNAKALIAHSISDAVARRHKGGPKYSGIYLQIVGDGIAEKNAYNTDVEFTQALRMSHLYKLYASFGFREVFPWVRPSRQSSSSPLRLLKDDKIWLKSGKLTSAATIHMVLPFPSASSGDDWTTWTTWTRGVIAPLARIHVPREILPQRPKTVRSGEGERRGRRRK